MAVFSSHLRGLGQVYGMPWAGKLERPTQGDYNFDRFIFEEVLKGEGPTIDLMLSRDYYKTARGLSVRQEKALYAMHFELKMGRENRLTNEEIASKLVLARGRTYRRADMNEAEYIGERLWWNESTKSLRKMSCGRGTGHLGSGLYSFGTLRAALRGGNENNVWAFPAPSNPYVTRQDGKPPAFKKTAFELVRFGKALICAMDNGFENLDSNERLFLEFQGIRYDSGLQLARAAVDAAKKLDLFHPMTHYMRAIGYDGVMHDSWWELNSGDNGCIWYPEV